VSAQNARAQKATCNICHSNFQAINVLISPFDMMSPHQSTLTTHQTNKIYNVQYKGNL